MFSTDQYQLIDFGDGRRLERFGPWTLDRPCAAAADIARATPDAWSAADARFVLTSSDTERGRWHFARPLPPCWTIHGGPLSLELKPTGFGHLGVFPEQAACWEWIAQQVRRETKPPRVLNLFAYTGGSTLAAAAAGAEVVHVDSARNTLTWARRNAEHSGLSAAPIRWIAEDALKFARREVRRGNRYDAVILDPPSYGHGPQGEVWQLADSLTPLLELCAELTAGRPRFMLLTCHTPGFGPAELAAHLSGAVFGRCQSGLAADHLNVPSADGRRLPCGALARWPE